MPRTMHAVRPMTDLTLDALAETLLRRVFNNGQNRHLERFFFFDTSPLLKAYQSQTDHAQRVALRRRIDDNLVSARAHTLDQTRMREFERIINSWLDQKTHGVSNDPNVFSVWIRPNPNKENSYQMLFVSTVDAQRGGHSYFTFPHNIEPFPAGATPIRLADASEGFNHTSYAALRIFTNAESAELMRMSYHPDAAWHSFRKFINTLDNNPKYGLRIRGYMKNQIMTHIKTNDRYLLGGPAPRRSTSPPARFVPPSSGHHGRLFGDGNDEWANPTPYPPRGGSPPPARDAHEHASRGMAARMGFANLLPWKKRVPFQ